ncbi:hypothetical protein GCM10027435_11810 [Haloparvum alkalitolerans]|uniref:hypothetical protein n=1 Tax=Haloparvum alkalitolerans TaxID=1042953 RepID=UPI003CF46480
MTDSEYRERYRSVSNRYRDLRAFVENSRHADREEVVSILDTQSQLLETIGEMLEEYEAVVELVDDHDQKLDRLEAKAETVNGLSDENLVEAVETERTESRELGAMVERVEQQLDQRLDAIDQNVTDLGKTLATTDVYDPTAGSTDDIDPTEKADLDDILQDVSREGDDWHDR